MKLPKLVKMQLLDKLLAATRYLLRNQSLEAIREIVDVATVLWQYDNSPEKKNTRLFLSKEQLIGLSRCLPQEYRKECTPVDIRQIKTRR